MRKLSPLDIGPVRIQSPVILAPMTGVTDRPFRRIVKRYGAGLTVTEVPITYVERERGASKMSRSIVVEALWRVTVWGLTGRDRRFHRRQDSARLRQIVPPD